MYINSTHASYIHKIYIKKQMEVGDEQSIDMSLWENVYVTLTFEPMTSKI